jgi:hypothetical protein
MFWHIECWGISFMRSDVPILSTLVSVDSPIPIDRNKWRPIKAKPHGKKTVIAFGSAMFSATLKGSKSAVCHQVRRKLKQEASNGRCILIDVNEDLTSRNCSRCLKDGMVQVKGQLGAEVHELLKCKECSTVWNRDRNASRNLRFVALYSAEHNDERPSQFIKRATKRKVICKDKPHATYSGTSKLFTLKKKKSESCDN